MKHYFASTGLPWNWNYVWIVDHYVTKENLAAAKKWPKKCGPFPNILCNCMKTEYLLVVGDIWNRMYRAASHCTESLLISFSTSNSVLFFCFYLCPLRHHTFILEDILSKNLQPKASSESLPTNPCTPRSHRSSTDAPWLLILQKSSRARRFLEALPQIILEDTCAQSWASVKGLGNTDLCFCLTKVNFKDIKSVRQSILSWDQHCRCALTHGFLRLLLFP